MQRLVTGFQYNLGFSGKYYKAGTEEEGAADETGRNTALSTAFGMTETSSTGTRDLEEIIVDLVIFNL